MDQFLSFIREHDYLIGYMGLIYALSLAFIFHQLLSYEYYETDDGVLAVACGGERPYDRISRTRLIVICLVAPLSAVIVVIALISEP